ncbi:hypothetical protein ACVMVB_20055, partial [Stenotrophomonas maltophilia]
LCEIHSDLPVHHAITLCFSHESTSASTSAALRAARASDSPQGGRAGRKPGQGEHVDHCCGEQTVRH